MHNYTDYMSSLQHATACVLHNMCEDQEEAQGVALATITAVETTVFMA